MVKVCDFNCIQNKDTLAFSLCFKLRKANSFESANFFSFLVFFSPVFGIKSRSLLSIFSSSPEIPKTLITPKKKSVLAAKKINQEKAKVNVKYWLLFALRYS